MHEEYPPLPGYCFTHPSAIQSLLDESQRMLVKAYEAQNSDKPEEAFDYLTKAGEIICYLGEAADEQQNTKHALKEYIDVLSKAQLEQFEHDFPLLQHPRYPSELEATLKPPQEPKQPKKKQIKHLWSHEENERFLEGLKKYGEKGIKEIADYIKTRNPAQVRSHLQKYKLKNPLPKFMGESSEKSQKDKEKKMAEEKKEGKKSTNENANNK